MEYLRTLEDEDYVEAIKEGEIVKVPESVAMEEDLFILRRLIKPVKEVAHQNTVKKERIDLRNSSRLEEWKNAKVSVKKNNVTDDLIDNFHWHIARTRRMKNMNRKDLAKRIEASEEDVRMIEMGELPRDDFVLINRIENVLEMDLRREKMAGGNVTLADLQKMGEKKASEEIEKTHRKQMSGEVRGGVIQGDEIELIDFD